jgi:glycosidase
MVGYVCYADRFAGSLAGVRQHLDYLAELGVTYLHLMPLLRPREGENDGGYAVADYDTVNPRIGTMAELQELTADLHERSMTLCIDLVLNHTAREHEWARKAQAGVPGYRDMYLVYPDRTEPDAYERTLPEVFPSLAPGSFTEVKDLGWVWTSFHDARPVPRRPRPVPPGVRPGLRQPAHGDALVQPGDPRCPAGQLRAVPPTARAGAHLVGDLRPLPRHPDSLEGQVFAAIRALGEARRSLLALRSGGRTEILPTQSPSVLAYQRVHPRSAPFLALVNFSDVTQWPDAGIIARAGPVRACPRALHHRQAHHQHRPDRAAGLELPLAHRHLTDSFPVQRSRQA